MEFRMAFIFNCLIMSRYYKFIYESKYCFQIYNFTVYTIFKLNLLGAANFIKREILRRIYINLMEFMHLLQYQSFITSLVTNYNITFNNIVMYNCVYTCYQLISVDCQFNIYWNINNSHSHYHFQLITWIVMSPIFRYCSYYSCSVQKSYIA